MIFVGLGTSLWGRRAVMITIGGLPITLMRSGVALVMGLVFGGPAAAPRRRRPEAMWVFRHDGSDDLHGRCRSRCGAQLHRRASEIRVKLVIVVLAVAVSPYFTAIFGLRHLKNENPEPPGNSVRGWDDNRGARAVQDEAQSKLPASGLHRTLCSRQHPADGLGANYSGHDGRGLAKMFESRRAPEISLMFKGLHSPAWDCCTNSRTAGSEPQKEASILRYL